MIARLPALEIGLVTLRSSLLPLITATATPAASAGQILPSKYNVFAGPKSTIGHVVTSCRRSFLRFEGLMIRTLSSFPTIYLKYTILRISTLSRGFAPLASFTKAT
jgi:hypothetical protein